MPVSQARETSLIALVAAQMAICRGIIRGFFWDFPGISTALTPNIEANASTMVRTDSVVLGICSTSGAVRSRTKPGGSVTLRLGSGAGTGALRAASARALRAAASIRARRSL